MTHDSVSTKPGPYNYEAQTEPCPFCGGSGERLVPPPAEKPGRPVGSKGPRHGHVSTYQNIDCRCDLCRAAWREYNRKRRAS